MRKTGKIGFYDGRLLAAINQKPVFFEDSGRLVDAAGSVVGNYALSEDSINLRVSGRSYRVVKYQAMKAFSGKMSDIMEVVN